MALTPQFWREPGAFRELTDRVLARSWHCIGDLRELDAPGSWSPRTLLPGSLDEPVLVIRTEEGLVARANVCTHRLAILAEGPGRGRALRCPYHGRTFDLHGRCRAQRGFSGVVEDFPGPSDDLAHVQLASFAGLLFAAVDPLVSFEELVAPIRGLLPELDLSDGAVEEGPVYEVEAPFLAWAENYLEGLHVPYVHPGLNAVLDTTDYRVQALPYGCSVQAGLVDGDQPALPDHEAWPGARLGGLYATIFPTTMLNLYPWGVSLNLIEPIAAQRCRIRYRAYVRDASLRDAGAGASLDQVEAEDQAVVRSVGRGMRSRLARPPCFAPGHEDGVAAYHEELSRLLGSSPPQSHPSP